MYVISHGSNHIAAYPTQSEAAIAAAATEPIFVEGALVPATVLTLKKDEYSISEGMLHSAKFNIQVPIVAQRRWSDRTPTKCKHRGCQKFTRSVTEYCRNHVPNSKYR